MSDLSDIVRRATGIHDAIAADLTPLGGILRCRTCQNEHPIGEIASYLRHGWPKCCGKTMAWVTQQDLAAERAHP